ncbi:MULTISPECIES: NmrA/HSCARG family protein [unclassified Crossiella]|uniref:NmrA/HSCARG family protein n=1 Tax=unclassified Crossiella TaxID=2620835 RepID=UPI00200002CE|nr:MULTISPECIES: NmrA/HSCARG family protein [unclassified Crossiella]MCK2239142.1 NmrA/HSCARG family protein [Crossiella sp. S99.2]MCK2251289.1 NmrA/HSCARG family protein [Crossiella sp. S99.1]
MSDKKIIAVIGATGAQGGGLARAILDDPAGPFALRAITRDPASPAARALAERGAEVVQADLDEEDSIRRAFTGAYGAFVVTNFWAALTPEQEAARNRAQLEIDQAHTAAKIAAEIGLKHVVWSTLDDSRPQFTHRGIELPTLLGRYKVPHFDAKAEADARFTELGVPTTFLQTTFFYEAFLIGQGPQRDAEGNLVLTTPIGDSPMAMIAVEDIGRTAYGIFSRGGEFVGRTVAIAGTHATGKEIAALFTDVLGEPVSFRPSTPEEVRASGHPLADEIAATFQFYADTADYFVGARDLNQVRELNPRLQSLADWLKANAAKIPRD